MKLLVLLFLVGYAAAYPGDGLDRTLEGQVRDLLGEPEFLTVYYADDDNDVKTELGKKLKEHFDELLEKVKDAIDHGKTVREDVINKLKDIREQLKDLKVEVGDRAKELLQKIKDKAKDFLKNLLDRLGLKDDKDVAVRAAAFEREVEEMIQRAEDDDDVKTELGKKLKEHLDDLLEKIKDSIEQGKTVKEELINKAKEVREKLKELKIDIGDRAKELYEKLKEKAKDFLKDLLDKLGLKDKRSVQHASIKNLFKKLKDAILDTIDKEKLKQKIEEFFGKGNELGDQLLNMLKEKGDKGKQKLLDLIDRILGDDDEKETRSLQDLWEKVKDYFKDLHIDLKEKYLKFGEWVKEKVSKGIDASKSKLENIKAIAKEFVENAKGVRKDIAVEALEFLRPYKEDLGTLWDQVKDSVKEILGKQE